MYISGRPSAGRIFVRWPATSSSAGATHRLVLVFSSAQASSRSRTPLISGQDSTATVSAPTLATRSATQSTPCTAGMPATSASSAPPTRHAATTDRP